MQGVTSFGAVVQSCTQELGSGNGLTSVNAEVLKGKLEVGDVWTELLLHEHLPSNGCHAVSEAAGGRKVVAGQWAMESPASTAPKARAEEGAPCEPPG